MTLEARIRMLLAASILAGIVVFMLLPNAIDWTRSFSQLHTKPYGTALVYDLLQHDYANATPHPRRVTTLDLPVTDFPRFGIESGGKTWLIINTTYDPDAVEIDRLLAEVERGTNLFIAARLGRGLADTLAVFQRSIQNRPILYRYTAAPDTETLVPITFPLLAEGVLERATLTLDLFTDYYMDLSDAPEATVLAHVENQPIMVRLQRGKGVITLLTAPALLTNYHFWREDLEPAATAVMAHIPGGEILWDEHFKVGRPRYTTPLQLVLNNDYLRPAYFLGLFGILLFVVFKAKREQRPMPVHLPPQNTSKNYIRRISSLLYAHDAQRTILDKRIRYLAHLLQLSGTDAPEAEVDQVTEKYGLPTGLLREVLASHGQRGQNDAQIFHLNTQIETILNYATTRGI